MEADKAKFLNFGRVAGQYLQDYQTENGALASLLVLLPQSKDPTDAHVMCTTATDLEYDEALDSILACIEAAILTLKVYEVDTGVIYETLHSAIARASGVSVFNARVSEDEPSN
jgi:hypothetical protein